MTEYPIHPAAELFPMMGDAELRELAEDIKANGLLERIVLHDGQILDGRNRLAACRIAEVEPQYENPNGAISSPVIYVLSKNLHRRHLTVSQRAAIAAETLPLLREEAQSRKLQNLRKGAEIPEQPNSTVRGEAAKIAAHAAQVGASAVKQAWKVKQENPEVFEKVKRGELTVNAAANGHTEQPKQGGSALDKDLSSGRGRVRAEANKRRMIDGLSVIGGVCHGLAGADIQLITAACNPEEIETWATKAETHARELRKFAAKLRGDNGKSE